MKQKIIILTLFTFLFISNTNSQEIYVDPYNGKNSNNGSFEKPIKSISNALDYANSLTGNGSITIKLYPGLYILNDRLDINPVRKMNDSTRYIIEAVHMPDDTDWAQNKMPRIQSISQNNSITQFAHATGILVASEFVTIRGVKFLGNPNPNVSYYYPISKENSELEDLEVSQCYFIGDKESSPIQGGVWAHGPKNTVINSIFYECRNAILFFNNVHDFTIKNTIVSGAYESAFWFGADDYNFTFENNIIINNNNFLVGPKNLKYSSLFLNSIIAGNTGYVGYWSRENQKVLALTKPNIVEQKIIKSGKVQLLNNSKVLLDKKHLHLTSNSKGHELKAGIFKD